MTYTGHKVLKTLIRCHFSPPSSTGQQYIYSGSEDGRVHIWNLDGTVARIIDVGKARTLETNPTIMRPESYRRSRQVGAVVRDVSWHPYEGVIVFPIRICADEQVSSSWTSLYGDSGAVMIHAHEHR
jgi:DDB1- and CUL4-associated factor 11